MSEPGRPAPSAFPGDKPITPELVREHKISSDEYARILDRLGRPPTYTELGVFSVMWSEHCSYKSSRVHLKRLPTKGPRVIQGPGENAGVVDIGDGFAAVFKIESHNHPSFIEPHQGAATGVGGILRDVFTMGARPIASLDSLRFGRPDHPRTPELVRGVVEGIGGYGNSIGVPTVGGEVQFDASYDGNILVNAFTCGVARTDRIFYGRASGVGNPILYIGAKTGRDGIHGATMASDEFSDASHEGGAGAAHAATSGAHGVASGGASGGGAASAPKKQRPTLRTTMQVGDPFMGKLLLEACLELFESDTLEGIQDMGAAGLTSSSVEMAGRAESGVEIDLDRVPRRAKRMLPYELLLSESQERMLLVAKRGQEDRVLAICKRWDLDAAVIGRVTDTGRWVVKATPGYDPLADDAAPAAEPVVVCDLPTSALTDDAPLYDRPRKPRAEDPALAADAAHDDHGDDVPVPTANDWADELLAACGSANLGSRAKVWEQYDHVVRGGTVVRPGSDAGVVRVPCERDGVTIDKHLAFAVDGNGRHVAVDPFDGGARVVAEVCRNLVCSGAEPIGLTDCLNFGNPERPEVMEDFARAVDGVAAACTALSVPIVSGNVSLYNETTVESAGGKRETRSILPTPTLAGVGLVGAPEHVVTQWFKSTGDVVVLLGGIGGELASLAGSEYLARRGGSVRGHARIDLDLERRVQGLVLGLARAGLLASAHDVSEGGLAVALAECTCTGPSAATDLGARIDLDLPLAHGARPSDREITARTAALLFGESPSRIVVSVRADRLAELLDRARSANVQALELGVIGGDSLSIAVRRREAPTPSLLHLPVAAVRDARARCLDAIVD